MVLLPEQRRIAARAGRIAVGGGRAEAPEAETAAELDALLPARAFASQLVLQNPSDEPAEKLLENIRIRSAKEG